MRRAARVAVVAALLALAIHARATAGPFEDGLAAYNANDFAKAMALWRPLAQRGDAGAQNNLGYMYLRGMGVPADAEQATAWYRRAAEQGLADAQFNLGTAYLGGNGVPRDNAQGYMWLDLAARRYPETEATKRRTASMARDIAASMLTADQLAEAQRLAREWKPK